ncbi:MAG: biliverdin-producing heme oxygenase [Chitinophagaceae bacterium]|nr:biliverdin-producing heme oxygenase [Chitinophagaceae bacterium]
MIIPLKEATNEKHKQAEKMPFNIRMFKGLLTKKEYLLYLEQQKQIFSEIENKGLPHESLARTTNIETDIEELIKQGFDSSAVLSSTNNYREYLRSLSYEEVLPHIYLNYLAIMFGGQLIKKKVPSIGMMYDFNNMQEAAQSIRIIQKDEWANEVNKGFDYIINIFEELENYCLKNFRN